MTTQALASVTLETLQNYQSAAAQTVAAYRAGGHRLVGLVDDGLLARMYVQTVKVAPRATKRMQSVRASVHSAVVKGLDQSAERTADVIERSAAAASAGVTRVADFAAELSNPYLANGLNAAASLSLPMAKLALGVSSKVAEGASTLARAAGAQPVAEAVDAGTKRVAKAVKRTRKTVKAVVAKTSRRRAA